MKVFRTLSLVALSFVVSLVAYLTLNFVQVLYVGNTSSNATADVIVVMGAAQYDGTPSPQLAARLDHALELFQQGRAPIIAVTGGNKPGDRYTEAESSAKYLVSRGVPEVAIIGEDRGRSTWESVSLLKDRLDSDGIRFLIVVTDPYHTQRTLLSFREAGFHAVGSPTQTSPVQGNVARGRALKESLGISLARFIGFERLWRITG